MEIMETNKKDIRIELSSSITNINIHIRIKITNISNDDIEFVFSNDTGALARNCIEITDENQTIQKPFDRVFISPSVNNIDKTILKANESETFELIGRFITEDELHILEFKGVSYKINLNRKYFLKFKYKSSTSNMIEIVNPS